MIVVSLLLILVAVTLLVLGLTGGSSSLLIGSIVASLLTAVALVIGARQAAARRPAGAGPAADEAAEPGAPEFVAEPSPQFVAERPATTTSDSFSSDSFPADAASAAESASSVRETEPATAGSEVAASGPPGHAEGAALADEFGEPDVDDPDDEPLPQAVRPADAVRVARLDAEVLVVDGRPRYHLAECPHLVGRLTEPIAVFEAVELGFSPCGLCRPVDRLVGVATRH